MRANLPVKLESSSTATQVQQLLRFEKQNQIAEAFLMACELIRDNPSAEFAYDAAIRTSLAMRQEADTEAFYRAAIQRAALPGKYYVQLAHFFSRTGKPEKLGKLLADYERDNARDSDYWITMARLHTVMGDNAKARILIEKAIQQKALIFPMSILLARAYGSLQLPDKARETLIAAMDQDIGPWEERELLLELLKLPGNKPEQLSLLFEAALINEVNYASARSLADALIDTVSSQRLFRPLREWLSQQIAQGKASDVLIWLAAVMVKREGNSGEALRLLTSDAATSTPVIAYERAMSFVDDERHEEAVEILNVLLAEQTIEVPIRLALAEQYLALEKQDLALQTLSAMPPQGLSASETTRYCEGMMRAVAATGDLSRMEDTWVELWETASVADLQLMGDVILSAAKTGEERQKLSDMISQRSVLPGEWPLLLLGARLASAGKDHNQELKCYTDYLEHDRENVEMLRFVAELSMQYAHKPLELRGKEGARGAPRIALRALDASGTELAIQLYRRLIELQPNVADHYAALMRVYQMRSETETAKRVALELAERGPESAEIQAMAASVLEENGFAADAITFFRRSLRVNPEDFSVWLKYANTCRAAGQFDEAETVAHKILEEGLHGKPYNQPQVFSLLLRIATEARRIPQLVGYLDGLRRYNIPGKAEFFLSASKLMMQANVYDKAEEFLVEFPKTFPNHRLLPDSYLLLGQLYFSRQDPARAITVFKDAAAKFPSSPAAVTACFNIGEIQRQTGAAKQAIASWLELAAKYPQDDRALSGIYEAAMTASMQLNDQPQATKLFQQFLASGSQDFSLLPKAQAALERTQAGKPAIEPEN